MTDKEAGEINAADLKQQGETLLAIAEALRKLPAEAQSRIIRALAVFYDVRLT